MLAALKPQKKNGEDLNTRLFVSHDTFGDHWALFTNPKLKKLFTRWQIYHQVRAHLVYSDIR